jgi:hypothetical protein
VRAAHGCLLSVESYKHVPAQKDDDSVAFGGDEAEHEYILRATIVAYHQRFHGTNVHSGMVSPSADSLCKMTSLCLALTRWLTICEAEVLPRELQNHLPHGRHYY